MIVKLDFDFSVREMYEFIIEYMTQNGVPLKQAHIKAVKITWGLYNEMKYGCEENNLDRFNRFSIDFQSYLKSVRSVA